MAGQDFAGTAVLTFARNLMNNLPIASSAYSASTRAWSRIPLSPSIRSFGIRAERSATPFRSLVARITPTARTPPSPAAYRDGFSLARHRNMPDGLIGCEPPDQRSMRGLDSQDVASAPRRSVDRLSCTTAPDCFQHLIGRQRQIGHAGTDRVGDGVGDGGRSGQVAGFANALRAEGTRSVLLFENQGIELRRRHDSPA